MSFRYLIFNWDFIYILSSNNYSVVGIYGSCMCWLMQCEGLFSDKSVLLRNSYSIHRAMGSYGNQPIQCSIDDSVCLEFSVRYVEHVENQYQLAIFTKVIDSMNYEHSHCRIYLHAFSPNAPKLVKHIYLMSLMSLMSLMPSHILFLMHVLLHTYTLWINVISIY